MIRHKLYSWDRTSEPAGISDVYAYKTLPQNFQTKFSQKTRKLMFIYTWYGAENCIQGLRGSIH